MKIYVVIVATLGGVEVNITPASCKSTEWRLMWFDQEEKTWLHIKAIEKYFLVFILADLGVIHVWFTVFLCFFSTLFSCRCRSTFCSENTSGAFYLSTLPLSGFRTTISLIQFGGISCYLPWLSSCRVLNKKKNMYKIDRLSQHSHSRTAVCDSHSCTTVRDSRRESAMNVQYCWHLRTQNVPQNWRTYISQHSYVLLESVFTHYHPYEY